MRIPSSHDGRRIWAVDNPSGRIPATDKERYEHQLRWRDCPWTPVEKPAGRCDDWRHSVSINGQPCVPRLWYTPTERGAIITSEPAPLPYERTALEEASHACTDDELGLRVASLRISEDGSGEAIAKDGDGPIEAETVRKSAVALWAGAVAQQRRYGNVAGTDADMKKLGLCAAILKLEGRAAADFISDARKQAEAIAVRRWNDIEKVAGLLQLVRSMESRHFYQCLGKDEPVAVQGMQVRREMLPLMTRSAELKPAGDEYEAVFSSGATVRRRDVYGDAYDEQLFMGSDNVDLTRLQKGAPLLAAHDASRLESIVGVVTSARLENGLGIVRFRLSNRPEAAGVVQDVRDGILKNLSVGYSIQTAEREMRRDDVPLLKVTRWTPAEVSIVPIPADPFAQVRKDAPTHEAMVRQ